MKEGRRDRLVLRSEPTEDERDGDHVLDGVAVKVAGARETDVRAVAATSDDDRCKTTHSRSAKLASGPDLSMILRSARQLQASARIWRAWRQQGSDKGRVTNLMAASCVLILTLAMSSDVLPAFLSCSWRMREHSTAVCARHVKQEGGQRFHSSFVRWGRRRRCGIRPTCAWNSAGKLILNKIFSIT